MTKAALRKEFLSLRSSLSPKRRREAASAVAEFFISAPVVLSYSPIQNELDLSGLNRVLAKQKRLALPRVQGDSLEIYLVDSPKNQLVKSIWGILEPIPSSCQQLSPDQVSQALVPGLAFDRQRQRLGYGKGYYDRLLTATPHIRSVGVGFKEQLVDALPYDSHDHPLDELQLF